VIARRKSLLAKLVLRVLVLVVCLILVVVGSIVHSLQTSVDTLRDRTLQGQAFDIARHLTLTPDGNIDLMLPESLASCYQSQLGSIGYSVVNEAGTVLFSSPGVVAPLANPGITRELAIFRASRNGNEYFGYSLPWRLGLQRIWIQVEQSTDHDDVLAEAVILEVLDDSGWFVAIASAALLFIIYLTIRTTLAPIREVSQSAGEIGPGSLDARLPLEGLPREITPLVRAVNGALDRIRDGFSIQKEFTANAAHELKTPLAVLRADLETSGAGAANPQLLADVDRISRVVNQLLRMAELESGTAWRFVPTDLRAVAIDIASFIAPIAVRQNKEIEIVGDTPNMVTGDAVLLHHALRNLVENALDHTPEHTAVTVDVSQPGRLLVLDRGPGVPGRPRASVQALLAGFRRTLRQWRRSRAVNCICNCRST